MTDRPPLIGLTCYTTQFPDWAVNAPGHAVDFLLRDYPLAVEAAGGIPVLLPLWQHPDTVARCLERLDGLLVSGGQDVSPRCYGEEPMVGCRETDPERDRLELALVREAAQRGLPVLGICRGVQLICVAFGGTLHQDVYTQLEGCLDHNQKAPKRVNTHTVSLAKGSRLREIVGSESAWVNSNHHQAVKDIPAGFRVSAKARDGVVEGLEKQGQGFVLGVQWHPEGTWREDEVSRRLFAALVREAALH